MMDVLYDGCLLPSALWEMVAHIGKIGRFRSQLACRQKIITSKLEVTREEKIIGRQEENIQNIQRQNNLWSKNLLVLSEKTKRRYLIWDNKALLVQICLILFLIFCDKKADFLSEFEKSIHRKNSISIFQSRYFHFQDILFCTYIEFPMVLWPKIRLISIFTKKFPPF